MSRSIISGAGLLFLTNLAAIMASAFLVFYLVQMDAPSVRTRIDSSILERVSRNRFSRLIERTRVSRAFGDIGKLRWRVVMLLAVLAILFFPLRESLNRVRDEAVGRAAARDAVRMIAAPAGIVSQQTEIGRDRIFVRLVVTTAVNREQVRQAERLLLKRTGKEASIAVQKVAADEELAILRESLRLAAPPPPPRTVEDLRTDVLGRIEGPLREVWPSGNAELLAYEVGFTPEDVVVRVRYKSAEPLEPATEAVLANFLRGRIETEKLRLILEREPPPRPPRRVR
jgi:hypothetical protein